jgi:hypothetical protein
VLYVVVLVVGQHAEISRAITVAGKGQVVTE